ncbi:hypothetical protein D9757_008307 [Collybiopsis confluens]|uniref:AMP-dependent synthetase/ligase domain-containing protein n=1 Tax=Collybiopsis confluens TaxID=2823264 RepID=A0A8H5H4G9_9AGAR|nr:hypothetical protein D9757_008307 [Collybiopsis confluens]
MCHAKFPPFKLKCPCQPNWDSHSYTSTAALAMIFAELACSLALATAVFAQYGPPPSSTSSSASAPASIPSAPPSTQNQINVDVAFNGQFVFNPNNFSAPIGTLVTFYFPGGDIPHSVTQSSFASPCTYLEANSTTQTGPGFDSALTNAVQFTINVTDNERIWFHCKQLLHCGMGMVGSINAPSNGSNTFDAFHSAALKIGGSEVAQNSGGPVIGGVHGVATATPAATATSSSGSSGSSGSSSPSSASAATLHSTFIIMFAKIPQRLTAPLGLFSDSEKLAFRSQPNGLQKLATVRNIPETDSYWDQFVILFDSASEVFSLITPNDIRRALLEAPENVATLVLVVCSRLFHLISDHTFPTPSASMSSLATSFIKAGSGISDRNTTKEVLNCLRVLTRVLPVVFENQTEEGSFEEDIFWKKEVDGFEEEASSEAEAPQFVIEDDDESSDEARASDPPPPVADKSKAKKLLPSLGERLFSSIIDLMFCCGFTLPIQIQKDHYKINYVIWERGIGSTTESGPSHQYDSNKTEVLRLLLVLLSRQIYTSAASLFVRPSTYTLYLVQKLARRDVLTILCSLLNTAMNSPHAQPITINSMAGKLPYNHLVFKGEDPRMNLVAICFEVLLALLDFQSGSARDVVIGSNEQQNSLPTARTNAFRYFLMKLHRTQDFQFILDGIYGIMEQQVMSMNNILPGARKSTPYVAENIIFFWKMVELNKRFRAFILDSDRGIDLIAYLLCYNLEIKDRPQQHGTCRALSYIIQTLSAEPAFGQRLTNPIKVSLPAKFSVSGTAADFLVNTIYSMVATTSGQLNSLYPALIIALSNCAPYFKNLGVTSSTRLVQLFASFSNPLFLLSDEGHPRLLFFMLDLFNSVILHHLSENPSLIHGILVAHKTFEDLGTFTLARGLREIRRVQLAKEDQAQKLGTDSKIKSGRVSSDDEITPGVGKNMLAKDGETHLSNQTQEPVPDEPVAAPELILSSSRESARNAAHPTSEKVKGKMKQRRSSSSLDAGSLERIAASGIGRNGFVPTPEWVTSWQQGPVYTPVVHQAFQKHAKQQPDVVAVEHGSFNQSITYQSLDAQSNRLAHRLRRQGIRPGSRVCILARRSVSLVVGILAALKSGAQYVPLDAMTIADETLAFVLEDSAPSMVLVMADYLERVSHSAVPVLCLEKSILEDELAQADSSEVEDLSSPSDGVYCIYTSGTTGRPKGVDVKHEGVMNVISGPPANVGMRPGLRVAQLLNIAFDMGAWEILGSLANGCTLCLRGNSFKEWVVVLKTVDIVISTPSILMRHNPQDYPNIQHVIVGGEPCPQSLADEWAAYTSFNNCCGPTEISICNTVQPHIAGYPLSIGTPIPNTNVYILSCDDDADALPIGQVGCMWVGAWGRTLEGDGLMYNTGDLGRWRLEDGQLDHLGRFDDQVKVKGFRVELDGVAAAMQASVLRAAVLLIDSELWGFVTPSTIDTALVREAVAKIQPNYAIPSHFFALDDFPNTRNGKVDKRALRTMVLNNIVPQDVPSLYSSGSSSPVSSDSEGIITPSTSRSSTLPSSNLHPDPLVLSEIVRSGADDLATLNENDLSPFSKNRRHIKRSGLLELRIDRRAIQGQ